MAGRGAKDEIEYRLLITRTYDETLKKEGIRFFLETTKHFTNFAYLIDIRDDVTDGAVHWSLHGLRAPSMNMPTTGAAQFSKVYFELPRKFGFEFVKKGSLRAATDVTQRKDSLQVSQQECGFLKIYTDAEEFERNRTSDALPPTAKPDIRRHPHRPSETDQRPR